MDERAAEGNKIESKTVWFSPEWIYLDLISCVCVCTSKRHTNPFGNVLVLLLAYAVMIIQSSAITINQVNTAVRRPFNSPHFWEQPAGCGAKWEINQTKINTRFLCPIAPNVYVHYTLHLRIVCKQFTHSCTQSNVYMRRHTAMQTNTKRLPSPAAAVVRSDYKMNKRVQTTIYLTAADSTRSHSINHFTYTVWIR